MNRGFAAKIRLQKPSGDQQRSCDSETSGEAAIQDSLGWRLCAALGTGVKNRPALKARDNRRANPRRTARQKQPGSFLGMNDIPPRT
jgi:hypothetical protein